MKNAAENYRRTVGYQEIGRLRSTVEEEIERSVQLGMFWVTINCYNEKKETIDLILEELTEHGYEAYIDVSDGGLMVRWAKEG